MAAVTLLPDRLPGFQFAVFTDVVDAGPIGPPEAYTEVPHWVRTVGPPAAEWVLKLSSRGPGRSVAAEVFCWLVGRAIGVPLPDGALYAGREGAGWLSRRIPDARNWSPEDRDLVANVAGMGSMLALDAVIANGDRHVQNVLVVEADAGERTLIAIDHGRAAIVHEARIMALVNGPPAVHPDRPDLTFRSLRPAALSAAAALQALPEEIVDGWLREAFHAEGALVPGALADLVLERFNVASATVERYLDALGVDR